MGKVSLLRFRLQKESNQLAGQSVKILINCNDGKNPVGLFHSELGH